MSRGHTRVSVLESAVDNLWLVSHPLFTLAWLEHLKRRNYYGLHAASLCLNGQGLLLPGRSGSGKSTLTLALLRGGFGFMGDDMAFFTPDQAGLRMFAFPEDIDVTHNTVAMFPELNDLLTQSKMAGAPKWQVSPQMVYNLDYVRACRPAVIVFPQVGHAENSVLQPLEEGAALLEVLPNVLLTDPTYSQNHLNVLGQLIKECDCYRLKTGRDLDTVPELLAQLLA